MERFVPLTVSGEAEDDEKRVEGDDGVEVFFEVDDDGDDVNEREDEPGGYHFATEQILSDEAEGGGNGVEPWDGAIGVAGEDCVKDKNSGDRGGGEENAERRRSSRDAQGSVADATVQPVPPPV